MTRHKHASAAEAQAERRRCEQARDAAVNALRPLMERKGWCYRFGWWVPARLSDEFRRNRR